MNGLILVQNYRQIKMENGHKLGYGNGINVKPAHGLNYDRNNMVF